jgi:SPX domain protein involved in polyphosphate accumulation
MLSTLKGNISSRLLAAKSNHTVSRASLLLALALAAGIAFLAGVFAFAQWRVAENLVRSQQLRSAEIARRVADAANMATLQTNAHRSTLNVLLSRDASEVEEADNQRRTNLSSYAALTDKVSDEVDLHDAADDLRQMTAQYGVLSSYVVDLFRQERKEEALELRIARLRPLYNRWQSAQEDFSKKVAGEDRRQQEMYAAAERTTKAWLAGLLVAPLALIAGGTLAVATILGLQLFGTPSPDSWSR